MTNGDVLGQPSSDALVFWPAKRTIKPAAAALAGFAGFSAFTWLATTTEDYGARLDGVPQPVMVASLGAVAAFLGIMFLRAAQRLGRRRPVLVIDNRGVQVAGPIRTQWVRASDQGFEMEPSVKGSSDEGITLRNPNGQQAVVLAKWLEDWQGAQAALQQLVDRDALPRQRSSLDVW